MLMLSGADYIEYRGNNLQIFPFLAVFQLLVGLPQREYRYHFLKTLDFLPRYNMKLQ